MKRVDTDTDDSGRGSSTIASSVYIINPDSEPEYYGLPIPPDGGYGWVIVGVCFMSFALVDGIAGVMGLLLPHILKEFDTTRALASLSTAIFTGVLMLVGPVVGVLINLFMCRSVAVVGGVIVSLSCFISSFATNIYTFILFYGAAMGLGAGMIYIPMMVMPGYYFEKKRAIANGIAYSGAGVGMLLMPLLTAFLLEHYDWRNVLIILSGVMMQTVVLGALMRPLTWVQTKTTTPTMEEEEERLDPDSPQTRHRKQRQESLTLHYSDDYNVFSDGYSKYILGRKESDVPNGRSRAGSVQNTRSRDGRWTQSCQVLANQERARLLKFPPPASVNVRHSNVNDREQNKWTGVQPFNIREIKNENEISPVLASCYEFSKIPDIAEKNLPKKGPVVDRKRLRYELLKPFARQDVLFTGSILNLKEYRNHKNMNSYITSVTSLPLDSEDSRYCCGQSISNQTRSMLHLSILLDPCFIILTLSGVTMVFGYYVPIVFMGDHTSKLGISSAGTALLMAIYGVTNSIGRVLSGALASSGWIDPLHIHVWSMVSAGIACCLMVTVCSNLLHLALAVGLYGLAIAMFVPLTTLFIVEYIGLSKLINAYGYYSLIKGVLGMAGPTISGAMIDQTGTFTSAYFFGGGMLAFSGLSLYLLPLASSWRKKYRRQSVEENDQDV